MVFDNWQRRVRLLILTLIAAPSFLAAQDEQPVLTINLGSGASQQTVSASTGGARKALGVAKPGAPFKLDMNALNIGKGKRVNVVSQGDQLLLVPDGTTDAGCESAAATGQGEQCRKLGAVAWGKSAMIGLNLVNGLIAMQGGFGLPRFTVGVGYGVQSYNKLGDVGCDMNAIPGLTACTPDKSGNGIAAFIEYNLLAYLIIGLAYHSSGYMVHQTFGQQTIDHDVSVSAFDGYFQFRPLRLGGPVSPYGSLGWSFLDNSSDLFGSGGSVLDSRSESGLRFFGGAGLDFRLGNRFGLRAGAEYRSGGSGDADTHIGFTTAITAHF